MPLADRNIVITPNRGASSEPQIRFTGADASNSATITLKIYNSSTVGQLSIEGNSGQLFSVVDTLSGSIFSVNDVSGIPSIEVFDTGEIRLAQYGGNVCVGLTSSTVRLDVSTATTNTISFVTTASTAGIRIKGRNENVHLQLGVGSNLMGPYGGWIQASYDNGGAQIGTEPLLLNPSGGNVGIGTTTTVGLLEVAGTARISGITTITNATASSSTTTGALQVVGGVGIGGNINVGGSTSYFAGNVGVGTSSPTSKAHVYGAGSTSNNPSTSASLGATLTVQDSGGSSGNGGMVMFGATQGYFAAVKGFITDGTSNTIGDLIVATRNGIADSTLTERVRIVSNGNVQFNNGIIEKVFTITDGAAVDINPTNGTIQLWTLGASRTPTASSFAAGQSVTLMILDGTAYTITWTTIGVTWVGGTAPTLDTTKYTVIELWKVSTTVYGALVGYA